jgi:hypothetical protein
MKEQKTGWYIKAIEIFDTLLVIIGLTCICTGMYRIYAPLGLITVGAVLALPGNLQFFRRKEVK